MRKLKIKLKIIYASYNSEFLTSVPPSLDSKLLKIHNIHDF